MSAHLVQEAHEVAEDGEVVFRKALQDLAAVGHPQAALHACNGMRVLPESSGGEGRVQGAECPPVGPGAATYFWPCGCSPQTLPPSCSLGQCSYPSPRADHCTNGRSWPGAGKLLPKGLGARWPTLINKALLVQPHPLTAYGCFCRVESGPQSLKYLPSGDLEKSVLSPVSTNLTPL